MTEGIKESEGKLTYELDWDFIQAMAQRMDDNKGEKYPAFNWIRPMSVDKLKASLIRHTVEVMKGNYEDMTELGHLTAIANNCMMIHYQLKNHQAPVSNFPTQEKVMMHEPEYHSYCSTTQESERHKNTLLLCDNLYCRNCQDLKKIFQNEQNV